MFLRRMYFARVVVSLLITVLTFLPVHQVQAAPNVCAAACAAVAAVELIECAEGCSLLLIGAPKCFVTCSGVVAVKLGICYYGCGVFTGGGGGQRIPSPTTTSPFLMEPGGTMTVSFGRVDTLGNFGHGQGNVAAVAFYMLNLDDLAVPISDTTTMANLPWSSPIGASFDGDSSWSIALAIPVVPPVNGYLMRCDMYDTELGPEPISGLTVIRQARATTGLSPNQSDDRVQFSASPNPTRSQTTLVFSMPTAGPAQLELYDLLGRRVRNWSWSSLPPGEHRIFWNGQFEDGKSVNSAIVFGRLTLSTGSYTTRIVRTE